MKGIILEQRVMRGETGGNWCIGESVCVLGNWAINRIRGHVLEVQMFRWYVRMEGVNGWQQKGTDMAVATSILPSALLLKVVECSRILNSSLA